MVTVLPYHLGFRPADSIVLVCLRGRRLGLVQRLDLPPRGTDPAAVVEVMLPAVLRERADRSMIVAYEMRQGDSEAVSEALRDALTAEGLQVLDRLVVRDGRWYSRECASGCCPPEGSPLPEDGDVPAVADFVALGRHPTASRDELDSRLAPVDGALMDQLVGEATPLMDELSQARCTGVGLDRLRRLALRDWALLLAVDDGTYLQTKLGVPTLARLAVSLRDVELRDLVTAWICPGTLELDVFEPALVRMASSLLPPTAVDGADGPDVETSVAQHRVEERLIQLCRHSPEAFATGPLTVLASFTWWLGDGALTRLAIDRALALDPDYRLAQLLERVVDLAIRPRRSA